MAYDKKCITIIHCSRCWVKILVMKIFWKDSIIFSITILKHRAQNDIIIKGFLLIFPEFAIEFVLPSVAE